MKTDSSFPLHTSFAVQPHAQGNGVSGTGRQRTAETAFALAAGDAEKGNPHAMMAMANFYERGLGAPRNFAKALEWYQKAARAGLSEGYYGLGICYEVGMGNPGDMDKAMTAYEKAAELGLAQAMQKLASLYITGHRIPQDNGKGLFWLNRAVEADLPDAHNTMGVIRLQGLMGQEIDEKEALEHFKKAAESGHLVAIRNIGIICLNGIDGKKSLGKALMWYLIASKGGYPMEDVQAVMEDLKKTLRPEQVQTAEAQAEQWLKNLKEKRQTVIGRPETPSVQ